MIFDEFCPNPLATSGAACATRELITGDSSCVLARQQLSELLTVLVDRTLLEKAPCWAPSSRGCTTSRRPGRTESVSWNVAAVPTDEQRARDLDTRKDLLQRRAASDPGRALRNHHPRLTSY
jgi:hypothetical protein